MWYNLWLTNVVCTNWETIPGWFCLTSDLHHHIGPQIGRRVLNPMWPYSTLWMRIDLQVSPWIIGIYADLEKDASGTCGHFSEIRLFWGLFYPNIPYLLLRMEKEELKMENGGWIKDIWGRGKENGRFRIEDGGLWIEDGGLWILDWHLRFEDSIMPHQHLIRIFLSIFCCESRYFGDIVKPLIFHFRRIHNFF